MKYVALILVLVGVLIGALAGRLCYLVEKFDGDSAMFIYMGRVVSDRGVVGRDVIDNKLPTVGLIMAPLWRAFGLNWPAYVLLGAVTSIGGALLLARTARRNFGPSAALPALLFALVYLNFSYAVYAGFQLETIQCLFSIIAAGAALAALRSHRKRDALIVGLSAGVGAMLKPSGLSVLGAFVLLTLIASNRRRNLKLVAASLAGLVIPVACVFAYILSKHATSETIELVRQIRRYAQNSVHDSSDAMKLLVVATAIGFPIFVRAVVMRRHRDPGVQASWFPIAWLALESLGIVLQGRMYAYHFLVLVPPATLLFAMIPRRERTFGTIAAVAPALILSTIGAAHVFQNRDNWPARLAVSEYLASRTTPDDAIWKDDAPRVWLETGTRAASAVPMTFLFANDDGAPARLVSRLLLDFQRTEPQYIVLPYDRERFVELQGESILELSRNPNRRAEVARAWNRIFDYVDQGYVMEARVGNEVVYRRLPR